MTRVARVTEGDHWGVCSHVPFRALDQEKVLLAGPLLFGLSVGSSSWCRGRTRDGLPHVRRMELCSDRKLKG